MSQSTGLSQSASQWVQANRVKLSNLPEPGVGFETTDVELSSSTLLAAKNLGIVKVPRRTNDNETQKYRNLWMVTQKGHNAIRKWTEKGKEKDGFLPCGHDAFRNLGDSLECKREGCNQIHDKEDL